MQSGWNVWKACRVTSRAGSPSAGGDNWIVSETTSPVNYTPIVTATTFSRRGSEWLPDAALHSLPWRSH